MRETSTCSERQKGGFRGASGSAFSPTLCLDQLNFIGLLVRKNERHLESGIYAQRDIIGSAIKQIETKTDP